MSLSFCTENEINKNTFVGCSIGTVRIVGTFGRGVRRPSGSMLKTTIVKFTQIATIQFRHFGKYMLGQIPTLYYVDQANM
jgi:hypothetical protein